LAEDPLLLVLLGPTASAKTALSLKLAEHFHGEIVNCDSVAMYREFDIGTAKPSFTERERVPHHLFDFVEPTSQITAGEYVQQARTALDQIKSRGNLPIVVGGTGLYLRALLEGLFPGPKRSDQLREKLRTRAHIKGGNYLHRLLLKLDSATGTKIHSNDIPKIIRAIEVCVLSKGKISEMWEAGREPLKGFRILRLGLDPPRDALYERINGRAMRMFDSGLVEETRRLLGRYGDAATAINSLGYKQAAQLIRREIDLAFAIKATQQAHRNYAKRQMTWFRREPDVIWLKGFGDSQEIQKEAIRAIDEFASPKKHLATRVPRC
jgi:tRNA dimethylallyltransferase